MNHEHLIAKLEAYGFSNSALNMVYNYLKGRRQRANVNGSFSSWMHINTGVPQGSILGPLLFNIYINDLFYFLDDEVTNYADDTTPYKTGKSINCVLEKLETNIETLNRWYKDNYFRLNQDKCELLVPKHGEDIQMNIGNSVIKGKDSVKLMGIKIDNKLNFNDHVASLCKKASQKLHALARISSFIEGNHLLILMRSFIDSQFSYCPLVWMFHSRELNNRINRIHEKSLRIAYRDVTSSFQELLAKDNSFTIHERNIQRLATEMYKVKNNLAPSFMNLTFPLSKVCVNSRNRYSFESSNIKSVHNGTETLSHRGPIIWSVISSDIKSKKTLCEFQAAIKNWKPVCLSLIHI